jgi:hypothetical protein
MLVAICEQSRADSLPFILALHCLVAFGFPLTEEVSVLSFAWFLR